MILIAGVRGSFWTSISVSLLFAVLPSYFSFGGADETYLATLFSTMSQFDLKFLPGKSPTNFFDFCFVTLVLDSYNQIYSIESNSHICPVKYADDLSFLDTP